MTTSNKNITVTVPTNSDQNVDILARAYQTELMEQAKSENLIVCLPTGSGKTYIAVMLIKEMSNSIRTSIKDGGKRTIFLVKTVQLVQQQSDYMRTHTDLIIETYYGELGVDLWNKQKWENEFENHQVLVFTAQVFLNLIDHNYFSLNNVNLIIFDECHHASGDNPYASLMNKHYDTCLNPPRILGLTASISNKKIKPKDLSDDAKDLEKTYRARIGCGTSRDESIQHGTSANVELIACPSYRDQIVKNNESLTIPFNFLRSMTSQIQNYLLKKKDEYEKIETKLSHTMLTSDYHGENLTVYNIQSGDYTAFTQSQSIILLNLKRYLENLIEIGYELGLWGLYLFAKELRKKLKSNKYLLLTSDQSARDLFDDIYQRLECLVDDILKNLHRLNQENYDVLFSPKVLKLLNRILQQKTTLGRCIVFVERVYTATILSDVLSVLATSLEPPWNTQLKVKHLTGTKAILSDKPMTAKYQRQTIKDFRSASINVLIATAVIEEGLDIPQCDLVIRFNKPQNFSSYMQSKGRARAKQKASYVLFMDESDADANLRDRSEYENYEEIEKIIQRGFQLDNNDDNLIDDLSQIPPYRPSEGVVIDAARAAQLIMQYCALLGNGQVFPPRFLFHGLSSPYTCILSMPANCPVRDDIKCQNKRKKLAKYECCLEMVKLLHVRGEFNEHCLPNRNRTILKIDIPLDTQLFKLTDNLFEKKTDSSFEIFSKQIATFPLKNDQVSNNWYLYRINNQLGFVIPCELMKLPRFNLYGHDDVSTIEVIYLKSIDYKQYQTKLQDFCQYLFEYVFDDMNMNSILHFDIEHSTFRLLPCLLTKSGDIDYNRMATICNRKNKSVQNYAELTDNEMYCPYHLKGRSLYMNISDRSLLKRASDKFDQKKELQNFETYADYFENKEPNVRIQRDSFLATMKGIKKPRINYLQDTSTTTKQDASDSSKDPVYYPIEFLRYAPLNPIDFELIYKLPSALARISQLYRIERLRKLFAENIKSYSLLNADQMPTVTFVDCLKTTQSLPLLPLIPLTYENISSNNIKLQPSPNILFQAVTRRSVGEKMDMENLEILGDCFLKLTVSMSLYHRYPLAGAGALTIEKGKQISNENLYRIAAQKRLKPYLNTMRIVFRGEDANWIPPGYIIKDTNDELKFKRYNKQEVKRKAVADMMEGFMGAFLVSSNYKITMELMKWLGLDVIPLDEKNQIMEIPSIVCASIPSGQVKDIIDKFYNEQSFSSIEKLIKYKFNDKAYLIAAFTHPSSFANRLTNCYERLEFLGDAVLDFLVIRHIFVNNTDITPGQVTDIRQDLSNNGRLAYILVAYRLHTKILHNSPDLFGKISVYAGDEDLFSKDSSIDLNKNIDQWADSTAPKALADVFEALVGAIFLDSNKCLATVWKVIEPLLHQYLDRSITDPNQQPVRSFFELGGKVVSEFSQKDIKNETTTSICFIQAPNGNQFIGRGVNKKLAKYDACRKAIKLQLGSIDAEK